MNMPALNTAAQTASMQVMLQARCPVATAAEGAKSVQHAQGLWYEVPESAGTDRAYLNAVWPAIIVSCLACILSVVLLAEVLKAPKRSFITRQQQLQQQV